MYIVISMPGKSLLVKSSLTIHLAHVVADVFTGRFDGSKTVHCELEEFAKRMRVDATSPYKKYCVDMSDPHRFVVTFSRDRGPRVLSYQGVPARIVGADLTIELQEVDCVRPGRIPVNEEREAYIGPEVRSDD